MKAVRENSQPDDFIDPARRALRRAAQKARKENQQLGLPSITWQNGKAVEKSAA